MGIDTAGFAKTGYSETDHKKIRDEFAKETCKELCKEQIAKKVVDNFSERIASCFEY